MTGPYSQERFGRVHMPNPYPSAHERIDQLEDLYVMLAADFSTYATMSKATVDGLINQLQAQAEQIKKLLTQAEQQRLNNIRAPKHPYSGIMYRHSDGRYYPYQEDC